MTTDRMVHLTIDDQEIACPEGWTVYEAATKAGIHIPTFCHHEKLVPVGACRMCLVEIEGTLNLQTSCSTPVREGMVVQVHTSLKAVEARRANIEFLLTNHPLDCPICDKGGECPLQDQALLDGPGKSRYVEEKRHKDKRYPLGEFIVLDQERCVLCWRCIRFLDEWADDHELDLFGRGAETRLTTFHGRPLTSKWQGNTIDICPVGALTERSETDNVWAALHDKTKHVVVKKIENDLSKTFVYVEISTRKDIVNKPLNLVLNTPYLIPEKTLLGMDLNEVCAEKVRAIMKRDKPRDLYDLFFLIQQCFI